MTKRPGSPNTPATPSGFQIGDYLRILYRRRWTAALALVVVFLYGAFNTLRKTPIYEASTQMLVEKDTRRASSLESVLEQPRGYYDEEFYQTQYRVLQSRSLAWRTVQQLGLKPATPAAQQVATQAPESGGIRQWIYDAIGAPRKILPPPPDETTAQAALVGGFLGGLSVSQIRGTNLIEIRYRSPRPEFTAQAANAHAEQYIASTLQSRMNATKETSDYLSSALEDQRKKMDDSARKLQQYMETNNAVGVDDRQNAITQRQADLNGKLVSARAERIDKEELFKTLTSLQERGDRAALEAHSAIVINELVVTARTALAELRQTKSAMAKTMLEANPEMIRMTQRIQQAENRLQTEVDRIVQSVKSDYLTAQGRERQFAEALQGQNAEAMTLSRKGVAYAALKEEADSNRQLFDTLLQRASETGISGEFKGTNIQIVDRAEVPRFPILPKTRSELMSAFMTGCVIAVCLAFGFEYLDSRIRTPDEIKTHLGLPFLGLVPVIAEKDAEGKSPLLSGTVPPAFSEAMRAIRTAVVFSSAEEGARSVVVTSTAPSEGKTLISTNLAVALAQADQRTLIIDGDMRRPRVHEVFEHLQEPGLSNVLVGTTDLHSAICRTSVKNLFVLSSGHIPPNPAELLGSAKYQEVMQDLRHQFDWIIVDAPPVMAVTDAAIVANGATGVVFVIGAEMTSRRLASIAIEQLNAVQAHFIGAVLNRANVQRHGYYYSTYYRKDYTRAYTRSS